MLLADILPTVQERSVVGMWLSPEANPSQPVKQLDMRSFRKIRKVDVFCEVSFRMCDDEAEEKQDTVALPFALRCPSFQHCPIWLCRQIVIPLQSPAVESECNVAVSLAGLNA